MSVAHPLWFQDVVPHLILDCMGKYGLCTFQNEGLHHHYALEVETIEYN